MGATEPSPERRQQMLASGFPLQPTRLIGRDVEFGHVVQSLRDPGVRLLTITGPAGCGKTRLAVTVAEAALQSFASGAVFVDLSPLRDARSVASAVADALSLQDVGARPLVDSIIAHLFGRNVLLVLDNFEHVLESVPLVHKLLEVCPDVRVLATSREPLHLRWEHRFPLEPLESPNLELPTTSEQLATVPSCQLFVERSSAVNPQFRMTTENSAAIAGICARLDGLPLAVELAAAWSGILGPSALLERLINGLELHTLESDRPLRQRSLRETIDWSYDRLEPHQQQLFRSVSVFAGDITASAVCLGDESDSEVIPRLAALVDKGLLQVRGIEDSEPRFRMLQTLREYAWERLAECGELTPMRRRHAAYYARLMRELETGYWGPHVVAWADRLEAELPNLRAALEWSLEPDADIRCGLEIVAFPYLWDLRGHIGEARQWLGRLLIDSRSTTAPLQRARALAADAYLALMVADHTTALERITEAVPLARASNDPGAMWFAISVLGHTLRHVDPSLSEPYLNEAHAIARAADYPAALADPWILGECRRAVGDHDGARSLFDECLSLSNVRGAPFTAAFAHRGLGQLDWMSGDCAQAETHLLEALRLHSSMRFTRGIADLLEVLAWNAASMHAADRAARLLGAAESVRSSLGIGIQVGYRAAHESASASGRERLGKDRFLTLFGEGQNWSTTQATAWALAPVVPNHGDFPQATVHLTARELEVVCVLAQGYSNRRIAEALTIAERTAETHVTNILSKLHLASRVQVRPWAVDHGLISSSPKDTY